jgi:hypothetical protein
MRAQATRRDQEDRPHPLRRACPDRSYRISQPRRRREGPSVRRSAHIQGMKQKDYKEVSPEPKDYGVATTPMIVARARGRPPEEMITTSTLG